MENIRNFCIIAHIDHGKSTLADRLLEFTGTLTSRQMQAQVLDNMDLEREKGITIKAHAIQMNYKLNGKEYILNLIDTPGHVDFSYEVSRSIAACEGALLIVDASQGIEAQTISNLYLALEHDLQIIPVLNKIDLPHAMPDEVTDEIVNLIGCKAEDVIRASAKEGIGIEDILRAVVDRIKAPAGNPKAPLQAMIFDSVFNGSIRKGEKIQFVNTGREYFAEEIGVLKLEKQPKGEISAGNVGYLISGIKIAREVKVGDTITHPEKPGEAIKGFENVKPMVFAGIYPVETSEFEELRASMEKLQLNDASLVWEPETSAARSDLNGNSE
jgi:GTP-binding protein LepA